jgi:phosphatidylglycerophosphate synthase
MILTTSSPSSIRFAVGAELLVGALPLALLAASMGASLSLAASFVPQVMALYASICVGILWKATELPTDRLGPGFGAANRVTLGRLLLALPLAALVLHPQALGVAGRWWVVGLGTLALSLDGLDGWVARQTGSHSAFGARFDMESDAAFILALSTLVWQSGQAPAWVLLLGAMRYLFVAAGRVVPALRGSLSPSLRRKIVCVVQGVALLLALGPVVPRGPATAAVGIALALLTWSFAVDTLWLLRQGSAPPSSHIRTA